MKPFAFIEDYLSDDRAGMLHLITAIVCIDLFHHPGAMNHNTDSGRIMAVTYQNTGSPADLKSVQ